MAQKPWQQGRFDGLCGIYSLINAVDYLCGRFTEDDCAALFKHLVIAGGDRFPQAIYDGLPFCALWEIAQTLPAYLADRALVHVSTPFRNRQEETPDAFFDAIGTEITGKRAVALVGLGEPWDHWTVITEVMPRSVRFHDSYGIKRRDRSKFSFAAAEGRIGLDYHQTILIVRP